MSPMITKFGLLSFASTALAAPWSIPSDYGYGYPGSHHHGTGTGSPTGTGAPYPAGNGTGPYGSGTGTGTAASTGFGYTGFTTVTQIVTAGYGSDVAAAGATSSSCSTPTVSTTTTHVVISTVSPNAFYSVPSVSTPAGYPEASSTPVAPVTTSTTSLEASPKPYTSQSVQAAGYGYGDFSFHWPQSSSAETTPVSSPAPVPTTPETSTTPVAPVETSTTPVISVPAVSIPTSVAIPSVVVPSSSAAPVATSSPSAPKPSSSYGGSTTGSKRGLPYNDASLTNCFAGSKISWAYNWGSSASDLNTDDFEYVPQLWGTADTFTGPWVEAAKSAISSGSKYILGFNEPDLPAQANLSPAAAAAAYETYISGEFGGSDVQLGSPAVTNGGGAMGLGWLSSFMDACASCQIDFVAIHWYDSYQNAAYFKQHVQQAHEQTGKPVWVTEFGTTDGSDDQIASFLEEVMPWMDSQDYVQRYAYFMAKDGLLNSGTEMSTYGKTFATYESS